MKARALLAIAVLAAACSRSAPGPASSPSSTSIVVTSNAPVGEFTTDSNGSQVVEIAGVRIEASADLPQRDSNTVVSATGNNLIVVVLRGWQVSVDAGKVFVGGRDFGAAPVGSVIRLAKDGVHVGSELRGPLP